MGTAYEVVPLNKKDKKMTTNEKIGIMQKFESGKKIESINIDDPNAKWEIDENPEWDWFGRKYREYIPNKTESNHKIATEEDLTVAGLLYTFDSGAIILPEYMQRKAKPNKQYLIKIYELGERPKKDKNV